MADNDFIEIPGASGNSAGGGEGQGASDVASGAPDRNALLEQRLSKMGDAIEKLMSNSRKSEDDGKKAELTRRINAAIGAKQKEVDAAETALAEAYEDGDGMAIAKAQRKLSELTATVERMRAEGRNALNSFNAEGSDAGDDDGADTTNLDAWKRQNKWFGTDATLTAAAREIDKEIQEAGVIEVGSSEYFAALDQQMARRYPDRFKGSPGSTATSGDAKGNTQGVTRLPRAVVDGWKRMGINTDDPDTLKRMMGHRQTAVNKGILDPTPRYGRVMD